MISEYLRLLSCDTSKDVRKAVLAAVGVTRATLPQIVARVRDVRPDVRAAAFEVLGEHVLLEQLSIEQRASLLESGLRDRSGVVQRACSRVLCCQWLPQCRGDPLRLLRALDAVSFEDTAALALGRLLREADVFRCGCGTGGKHFPSKITVEEPSRGKGKKKKKGRTLEVTLAQCVGLGVQRVKALVSGSSGGSTSGNLPALTPELALFWRCYVSHAGLVHSAGERGSGSGGKVGSKGAAGNAFARASHNARRLAEEALEASLPPLTPLCAKLREQWEEGSELARAAAAARTKRDEEGDDDEDEDEDDGLHEERVEESVFVQRQLLLLARAHDFGDEAGRRKCIDLLGLMLRSPDTDVELVEACMGTLLSAYNREGHFVRCLTELISDILCPIDEDGKEGEEGGGEGDGEGGEEEEKEESEIAKAKRTLAELRARVEALRKEKTEKVRGLE